MATDETTPEDVAERREQPPEDFEVIGQSMDRVEDPRLLTGQGEYVDDIHLQNMAEAAVLRSPHAHARIVNVDTGEAEAMEGVEAVLTGEYVAEETPTGPLPSFASPPVEQWCIAKDRVRHVGEPVAAVVAEDRYVAEDAIDAIDVEYEQLPAVVDPKRAMESEGDAVLHPERDDGYDGNVVHHNHFVFGEPDTRFEEADRVVERELYWPRSNGQPMETCGAVAEYDDGTGEFTIHANGSMYNYLGWLIAASLGVESHKLNIDPTIAGGSFGSKLFLHNVSVLAGTLAREAGRPVKFIQDRSDNMMNSDNHGCDHTYPSARMAIDDDGTMQAIDIDCIADYGAYFQFEVGHHGNAMAQVTGPYDIDSVDYELTAVATNKDQVGAYRGFGSEVQNWVLERLVDAAADEMDRNPAELRRQNFLEREQFPHKIPSGNIYDSGDYEAVLDKTLEMLDYEQWRERQAGPTTKGIMQTGYYEHPDRGGSYEESGVQGELRPGMETRDGPIHPWAGTRTGYFLKKFTSREVSCRDEQAYNPWPFLRYAEVLLNYAEASANLGDTQDALWALNKVRSRIGMPDVPADGGPNRTLMERIRQEREVELAFEDHRYWDVRRWMIAPEVYENVKRVRIEGHLDRDGELLVEHRYDYYYNVVTRIDRQWKDKNYFVPIPASEMRRNPELAQNPGY